MVLLAYDASRGLADTLGMPGPRDRAGAADRWLGGGVLPTVWLQHALDADWWDALAALVYSSHFVVTPVVLGVLWVRNRRCGPATSGGWWRCRPRAWPPTSSIPAAPPWLAAKDGVVEPIHRLSARAGTSSACPTPAHCWPTARGR